MRILLLVVIALQMAGCALSGRLPIGEEPEPRPQALFLEALDEALYTGRTDAFRTLQEEHPDSVWAARAGSLSEVLAAGNARQSRLVELQNEKEQLLRQKREHAERQVRCDQERKRLEEEIRSLKADLEKLSQILIDMELRAK